MFCCIAGHSFAFWFPGSWTRINDPNFFYLIFIESVFLSHFPSYLAAYTLSYGDRKWQMKMTCSFYTYFSSVKLKIFLNHERHFTEEILKYKAGTTSSDRHGVELEQPLQLLLPVLLPNGCQNTFWFMRETLSTCKSATLMFSNYLAPFTITKTLMNVWVGTYFRGDNRES